MKDNGEAAMRMLIKIDSHDSHLFTQTHMLTHNMKAQGLTAIQQFERCWLECEKMD
jgi:hypothetical protein